MRSTTSTAIAFPRVPLKAMDSAMLVFELDREAHRVMPHASEMITSAATMASFLHREQTRFVRGDLERVPYIEHPLRVALRLIRWGVTDARLITAALLHDVVEDCAEELLEVFARPEDDVQRCLSRLYGPVVTGHVLALTNPTDGTAYDDHVRALALQAGPALLIKASDLKDNAGSLKHQFGHGQDQKMLRLLAKYRPIVPFVTEGLTRVRESAGLPGHATTAAFGDVAVLDKALTDLAEQRGLAE